VANFFTNPNTMKLRYVLILACVFLSNLMSHAAWDVYKSGLSINSAFYDCQWASVAPDFQGHYFGRFTTSGNLELNFGEVLTYKNGSSNVCSGTLYYRVYRTCDTPPSFSTLNLGFCCNYNETDCTSGTCGPDLFNTGDQKWLGTSSVNLLSGLTAPGSYVIEVYFRITGDESDPSGCASEKFSNNSGSNYRAYFELNNTDSFSDGNFSSSPAWTGDTGAFTVATKSDAAGLNGTELNNSYTLRLNADPSSSGSQYLSTAITSWDEQQEWHFWHGRRNISASNANQTMIWLYANESNLESGTVDGYRIVIGDDTGDDEIRLQRVENGTGTDIFVTSSAIPNNIVDWGITFRVTRSNDGRWRIRTSTLPNANGTGATAFSCPGESSSVLHTNTINSQTYTDDNTYVPSGTNYIGVVGIHNNTSNGATGQEFDNFRFVPLPPDTEIQFTLSAASIDENISGGTYNLVISITNASTVTATTANIVRTSGDSARINGYTTQPITFAANTTSNQTVTLDITNNDFCDGTAVLTFEIQDVAGGTNAVVGIPSEFTLTIFDDNTGYANVLLDNFEDGNINGWNHQTFSGTSGAWTASTSGPITGTYSMRHTNTSTAGTTQVYYNTGNAVLSGVETTWRFNIRSFNLEPSPANKWQIFLAANESNLWGSTVDGYAVGTDPQESGDPDILTLWRVDNGVMTYPIVQADVSDVIYDWGTSQDFVGFEIIRSATGLWTLRVDPNGGFDDLSEIGSGSENTYSTMGFFGIRFIHTESNGGKMSIDDISATQTGCRVLYYSRGSGNFTDEIWSTQPTGDPEPDDIESGRWTRLVIQSGHTVTLNTNVACNDLLITSGGVVNGSSSTFSVFGDWTNNGTFNRNTSTVVLKGDESPGQLVQGSSLTTFNHLSIDNGFGTVTLNVPVHVRGVVRPERGTLQTGGNLTLKSNSNSSGSIGQIKSGASISGNVTLERFIPAGTAGWVFLGCPIPGQTISSAWNDDIVTTGFTGSNFPPPGYTFNNIQRYDESQPGNRNAGWVPATNITNVLSSTFGYNVYMSSSAQTIDVTGNIQSGNQNVSVPYTNNSSSADGWNLMTNIYPSEIDWVALEGNSNDFAVYYVYDSSLPGYRTYNANSQVGSASRYIPHSQSFFVKAATFGQTLNYLESHKTETNAAFERSTPDSKLIRFRVERSGLADEAMITFIDGATDDFDAFDAEKLESMSPTAPEMAFMSTDGVPLTIDARPEITSGVSISVWLDLPLAGNYNFIVDEVLNIQPGVCMLIEDTFTGNTITASEGSVLVVNTTEPFTGERLIIHFTAAAQITTTAESCFGGGNGKIELSATQGDWIYTLVNSLGVPVESGSTLGTIENLYGGAYYLEIENQEASCGAHNITIEIESPPMAQAWFGSISDICNNSLAGSVEFGVSNMDVYTYVITRAGGQIIASGESSDIAMLIDGLVGDVYTVSVTGECTGFNWEADLRDPNAVVPIIFATSTLVDIIDGQSVSLTFENYTPDAVSSEWTVDGSLVSSNETYTHTFFNEGTYQIGLTTSNGICEGTGAIEIMATESVAITEVVEAADKVTFQQADGGFYLAFQGVSSRRAEIRLINTLGQLAMSQQATPADGQRVYVDLSQLAAGAYTIHVIADGQDLFTKKVVR